MEDPAPIGSEFVSVKRINTISSDQSTCDVCGRTLLRGEHAEPFVNGNTRRNVCQLCISRALHEGWVREGARQALDNASSGSERRRSLLGRLRSRREHNGDAQPAAPAPSAHSGGEVPAGAGAPHGATDPPQRDSSWLARGRPRETRQVRAVPTSDGQRIVSAIGLFNASEHRRTVAGVARSLGRPDVNVTPDPQHPSVVRIVVSWELCWYRYEVDISDDVAGVRLLDQGYELTDLSDQERAANVVADDAGQLAVPPE